jgi:hypothetical protein
MALFKRKPGKMSRKELRSEGILGRGVVTGVQPTGSSMEVGGGIAQHVCIVSLEVAIDGVERYAAQCKERLSLTDIPRIVPGQTVFAVRVNPNDHQQVAVDWDSEPPEVTVARDDTSSAAALLASGESAEAVIVGSQPLGMKSPEGIDIHAMLLTVTREGVDPYQVQVGNPVPPAALPLLFPGSKVPVKVDRADPNKVVVDWDEAQAGGG